MKANLICGILAINLLSIDKAVECFKQIELDDDSNWYEDITNDEDLAFYGVMLLLSCPTYDLMKDLVLVANSDCKPQHQGHRKTIISVQTDGCSSYEEGI